MSALEVNKILAAILLAILVIVVISHLGDLIVNINEDKDKKIAYKIEIEESSEEAINNNDNKIDIEPISMLLQNASLERGKKLYNKCGSCHNYVKGSKNKVGPHLWNLINRPKANITGFAYSKALSEFGGVWSYEELASFLYKPKEYIEGTKMNFSGLKEVQDRADLVLFLRDQSDNPVELP